MSNRNKKLTLLGIITLACIIITFAVKPIPQWAGYHHFADTRKWLGIANFANVASNLPFIIIGCVGLALLRKARKEQLLVYAVLFIGIVLTGFGSGYYHLSPDNNTLVWDRIPMTIVFMAFLSATASETINKRLGFILLVPFLIIGTGSVLYWHFTELQGRGDLRLYGLVQFYPVLFIPLILILFPSAQASKSLRQLAWVVAWYIIAKIFEYFDWQMYALGHFVSGHTLKHLAAAVSTWYLVKMFKARHAS